jgi:hypothetical protein
MQRLREVAVNPGGDPEEQVRSRHRVPVLGMYRQLQALRQHLTSQRGVALLEVQVAHPDEHEGAISVVGQGPHRSYTRVNDSE